MTPKLPLTQSQTLLWAGQSMAADWPLYNMVWRITLAGEIEPDRFIEAFESVCRRSDALSSLFIDRGGVPELRIADSLPDFPEVLDLGGMADPENDAVAWILEDAARPIDLAVASYRTRLIRLGDARWIWYFNQHHIATDAWSGSLVFRALAERYAALGTDDPDPAPDLPKFADFARREAAANADGSLTKEWDHWAAVAAASGPSTPPYGMSRLGHSPASHRVQIAFGQDRSERLRRLAADPRFASFSRDLSIFALLATVFSAYLNRVTGDTVIRFGAPSQTRTQPQDKQTIGLFIEMFPLTIPVEPEDKFLSLFQRSMAEIFDYLRNAKPGAGSAATAGLFHSVLNYIPIIYGDFAGIPAKVEWLSSGAHDGQHDMRLHVYDFSDSGTFTVEIDFNSAMFDSEATARASGHLLALFDAFFADADTQLAKVALLGAADGPDPLGLASGAPTPARAAGILETFRRNVARQGDAPALASGGEMMSYQELDAASDAIAARLRECSADPRGGVVIFARRSKGLVASILGTLKSGGFFVPLAFDTPPERVSAIIDRVNPHCIIGDDTTLPLATSVTAAILNFDDVSSQPPHPVEQVAPGDLAYVIFTSGSTGEPKGVAVDHSSLDAYVDWAARVFGDAGPKDYPLFSSISFDLTLTSIFVPLVTGGLIRIYSEPQTGTDLSILDVFSDDAVDVVKLTPSHLALACAQERPVSRIGTLVLGGENLSVALCRQARAVLTENLVIANEYGPTEAVVGCMVHRFDPVADTGVSVPIGRPADDVSIYVLDDGDNPVPVGVTGQICIGGPRLARGYHDAPDLTAEVFVPDPFTAGGRMYRSGDLARVQPSGVINYLGRSDQQLKLSGVRIEPAEIECALTSLDGVRHAHVDILEAKSSSTEAGGAFCTKCGLSDSYPGTALGADGVCGICREFESYQDRAKIYFEPPEALTAELRKARERKRGQYDAIMLLSGGKDSAYATYRLAEITKDILALTLDNGFISDGAKANIRRITQDIGVDHRFITTPAMDEIFRDSLTRYSNVCQGCFKTIYSLALKVARDEGIPAIVTGLSRGQFFETRLTPELFKSRTPSVSEIEGVVLDARKSYHRIDDTVSRLLQTKDYIDDALLDNVRFIDIYRYLDVSVDEIYAFLRAHAPWIRPKDTGRSTNCLINDAGIHVHKAREGFHNYALPYSWDVRLGHKTRAEAMDELSDDIDPVKVHAILDRIGMTEEVAAPSKPRLVAYYIANTVIPERELRAHLGRNLPREMIPAHFIRLDALPLTGNGKVDKAALPWPDRKEAADEPTRIAPETDTERTLIALYQTVIGTEEIGVSDNFYDIGGDSIAAIQIALAAAEAGYDVSPTSIFEHQSIRALAMHVASATETADPSPVDQLVELDQGDMAALDRALSRPSRERSK